MERALSDQAVLEAARLLAEARVSGDRLTRLPEACRPRSHPDACAVFVRTAELLGEPVEGWKIGYSSRTGRLTLGPVLRSLAHSSGAVVRQGPAPVTAVEGEMTVRMAATPAGGDRDAVVAAIGTAHASIELIAPRFADIGSISPLEAQADCGINGGLVVADGRPFDLAMVSPDRVQVRLDGATAVDQPGSVAEPDVIDAIAWLAGALEEAGLRLEPGHLVATGTRTGLVRLEGAKEVSIDLGRLGAVSVTLADAGA